MTAERTTTVAVVAPDGPIPRYLAELRDWLAGQPGVAAQGWHLAGGNARASLDRGGPARLTWRWLCRIEARNLPPRGLGSVLANAQASAAAWPPVHVDAPLDPWPDVAILTATMSDFGARLAAGGATVLILDLDPAACGTAPPGFWPAHHEAPETRFGILRQRPGERTATPVLDGAVRTRHGYLRTHAGVAAHADAHLRRILSREIPLASGADPAYAQDASGARDIAGNTPVPALRHQARYLGRRAARAALRRTRALNTAWRNVEERWAVRYGAGHPLTVEPEALREIPNEPGRFLADPFLVTVRGRTVCFMEEFAFATRTGCIVAYDLTDGTAKRLGVALEEPWHLSFPYMFWYNNDLYMIPESTESGTIQLYRCHDFPLDWRRARVIMEGVSAAETLLFPHGDRWWLFTNMPLSATVSDHSSELWLFHADTPLASAWHAHPHNPVVLDPRCARNAGTFAPDGVRYRVSQHHGVGRYGERMTVHRIDHLTPERYQERVVRRLGPEMVPGTEGMHHLHAADGMVVLDVQRRERVGP